MKPGPRRSISQTQIVDTAFGILADKGFSAVSIRGVAAVIGLTPTAMYTYFASKDALLEAMVEELLRGLDLEGLADAATEWRVRVHSLAAALRARIDDHTGSITLLTSGPLDGERSLALREALIAGFAAAGLSLDDAARAAHAVLAHVIGWAALDAAARVGHPPDAAADAEPEPQSTVATLWADSSRHPLVEATAHLALDSGETGPNSPFVLALDRVLDGWLSA